MWRGAEPLHRPWDFRGPVPSEARIMEGHPGARQRSLAACAVKSYASSVCIVRCVVLSDGLLRPMRVRQRNCLHLVRRRPRGCCQRGIYLRASSARGMYNSRRALAVMLPLRCSEL